MVGPKIGKEKVSIYEGRKGQLPVLFTCGEPSGLRTVRVVVVVVGGEQFDDKLLDLLHSCSPILNFLRGGIRGSLTIFLFGVGSVAQKNQIPQIQGGIHPWLSVFVMVFYFFATFFTLVILSMPQVLEQSLFLF